MAYDLSAIRKAKQTYKTPKAVMPAPLQAVKALSSTVPNKTTTLPVMAAQAMATNTPAVPRTEQTLNTIQSAVNKPFQFNADTDHGYQAALRAAQQNLQVSQKNTNAQLRASGQGKSSYSETVANQLANQSNENIANNILPQYVQQAYQQYQDGISNQSNLYGLQYQQDVTTPQNEAQITGNYVPPAAKAAIDNLLQLKQQAETKGITANDRAALSQQADGIRAQLQAMGIDPAKYGANVSAAQAGAINPGIRTLAGQAQDTSKQESQFNQGITTAQLTGVMPNGTKTTTEQQRQLANLWTAAEQTGTIPNELATLYGLPQGTQTLAAKQFAQQLAVSQQNADTSQASAKSSMNNNSFGRLMDVWKATGAAPSGLEAYGVAPGEQWFQEAAQIKENSMTPQQVLSNIRELYQEPIMTTTTNSLGQPVQEDSGKTKLTTEPTKRKQMFDNVVDSGLSNTETMQVLSSLGFSKEEITKMYNEGLSSGGQ